MTLERIAEKIGKKVEGIMGKIEEKAPYYAKIAGETFERMGNDLLHAADMGADKLEAAIGRVRSNEYVQDFMKTACDATHTTLDGARDALRTKREQYKGKMDSLAQEKPDVAGFIDGFVNAYLATPCDRSQGEAYKRNITYGKIAGWATAVMVFDPRKPGRALIGSLPVLSRVYRYVSETLEDAKESVDAGVAVEPASSPVSNPEVTHKRKVRKRPKKQE